MSAHTPGPWETHGSKTYSADVSICGRTKKHKNPIWIARVYGEGVLSSDTQTRDANARLIAAAPEMLRCLEDFVDFVSPGDDVPLAAILEDARAVIAKAKGES